MSPAKVIYGQRLTDAFKFMGRIRPQTGGEQRRRCRRTSRTGQRKTQTLSRRWLQPAVNAGDSTGAARASPTAASRQANTRRADPPTAAPAKGEQRRRRRSTSQTGQRKTRTLYRRWTQPAVNTADSTGAARVSPTAASGQANTRQKDPPTPAPASAGRAKPTTAEDRSNTSASLRKTALPASEVYSAPPKVVYYA